MNAEMIQPKNKLIEIGKQYRGTWLLAGLDLLIVLGLWAVVAYNPGTHKPVADSQPIQARLNTAVNAESVRAHPNLRPVARTSFVGPSHGAACSALPAGCAGGVHVSASNLAMPCQTESHAAQHRNGDLDNPNPC